MVRFRKIQSHHPALLLLLLLLIPVPGEAQVYPHRRYTMREGLPGNHILCIHKDSRDLLWIGTEGGLCSFDGLFFRIYSHAEGMTTAPVTAITEDDMGTLRFTTAGEGLFAYNGRSFRRQSDGKAIAQINAGTTTQTTNETNAETATKTTAGTTDTRSGSEHPTPFITSRGDTIRPNDGQGILICRDGEEMAVGDTLGPVTGMAEDFLGDLWLATATVPEEGIDGGLYRYRQGEIRNYASTFDVNVDGWILWFDREQHILWIGTPGNGLIKAPFTGFTYYYPDHFGLEKNPVNTVFVDHHSRLWVSGRDDMIIVNPDSSFTVPDREHLLPEYLKPDGTAAGSPPEFGPVVSDGMDSYFISYKAGLLHYRESDNRFTHLNIDTRNHELLLFRDTLVVAGTETTIYPAAASLPGRETDAAAMAMAFNNGSEPREVSGVVHLNDCCWYTSRSSGLWMSRGMELVHLNAADSSISNNLTALCTGPGGHLIFGSYSGEITVAEITSDGVRIIHRIGQSDGIKGNSIRWLTAGADGMLWAGTNQGINSIDLNELLGSGRLVISIAGGGEGYTGFESTRAAIDGHQNLWLGTNDYLIKVNTLFIRNNRPANGRLLLRGIEINYRQPDSALLASLDPWTLLPRERLELRHNENNLTFHIGINNHNNPRKDLYRYRVKGSANEQHKWSSSDRIVLNHLYPGSYTLIAESYNLNTLWQTGPLHFPFTIRPPWWGLWYVQAAAIIIMAILTLLLIRYYIRNEKRKQQERHLTEKKILQLEMQALQAQMNPHFIFNCITGIQYLMLANKTDDLMACLGDFSRVVRESLENATQRMVPFEKALNLTQSYLRLELMRFPDRFDYKIVVPSDLQNRAIMIPPMMVQPFVENAVRHGFMNMERKGDLSVVFEKIAADVLQCTITDNGIGRTRAAQRTKERSVDRPHSIAITQSRLRLWNAPDHPDKYRITFTDLSESEHRAEITDDRQPGISTADSQGNGATNPNEHKTASGASREPAKTGGHPAEESGSTGLQVVIRMPME